MRIRLRCNDGSVADQAQRLIRLVLAPVADEIADARLDVTTMQDALGTELTRCRLRLVLHQGSTIRVEERQPETHLAVARLLDRGRRTVQRRLRAA